jgi:translation initiation factor 5
MHRSRQFLAPGEKAKKAFLGGFERYVGVTHPELAPLTPKVLMALYQEEVLDDEELLISWGTHTSKKYVDKDVSKKVRSAAAPFIKVCLVVGLDYRVTDSHLVVARGSRG